MKNLKSPILQNRHIVTKEHVQTTPGCKKHFSLRIYGVSNKTIEYDQFYAVTTATRECFLSISSLFQLSSAFVLSVYSERQYQLDKIDGSAFFLLPCGCHLNDVDKVKQGGHNSAARFEHFWLRRVFFYTNVYSSALDP